MIQEELSKRSNTSLCKQVPLDRSLEDKTYNLKQINPDLPTPEFLTQKILSEINSILKLNPWDLRRQPLKAIKNLKAQQKLLSVLGTQSILEEGIVGKKIQTASNFQQMCIEFFKYIEIAETNPEVKEKAREFVFRTILDESHRVSSMIASTVKIAGILSDQIIKETDPAVIENLTNKRDKIIEQIGKINISTNNTRTYNINKVKQAKESLAVGGIKVATSAFLGPLAGSVVALADLKNASQRIELSARNNKELELTKKNNTKLNIELSLLLTQIRQEIFSGQKSENEIRKIQKVLLPILWMKGLNNNNLEQLVELQGKDLPSKIGESYDLLTFPETEKQIVREVSAFVREWQRKTGTLKTKLGNEAKAVNQFDENVENEIQNKTKRIFGKEIKIKFGGKELALSEKVVRQLGIIISATTAAIGIGSGVGKALHLDSNWIENIQPVFGKGMEVVNLNPFEKPGTLTGYLFAKSKNLDEFLNSWANANVINPKTATERAKAMKAVLVDMNVTKLEQLKNLNKDGVEKVITALSEAQLTKKSGLWRQFTQSLATGNMPTVVANNQEFLGQLSDKQEFKKLITYNNGKYTLTIPSIKQSVSENMRDLVAGMYSSWILFVAGSAAYFNIEVYNKNRPFHNPRNNSRSSFVETTKKIGINLANRVGLSRLISKPAVNIDSIKSINTRAKALIDTVSKKDVSVDDQNRQSLLTEIKKIELKPDDKSYTEVFWEHFNNKNPSELSNNSLFIMIIKELKYQNSTILKPFVIALISNLSQKEDFKSMFAIYLGVDKENQILKNAYQTIDLSIRTAIQSIQTEHNKT